jgi:myo-inositol-1(or 4)-monophosphatase
MPGSAGMRRGGSAALDLAYTAAGIFDGFFELRLSPWDTAAGICLVREAGGAVAGLDGCDPLADGHLVAGNPALVADLLERLGRG